MAGYYRDLTRKEMEAIDHEHTIVLIPLGAIEQHGDQAPLGTDDFIAERLSNQVLEELNRIDEDFPLLVFPRLSIGLSTEHMNFSGSVTLSVETYYHYLRDILVSLQRHGFKKIALLSCHGGNTPIATILSRELRQEFQMEIFILNSGAFDDSRVQETISEGNELDFHGGEMETSMVMAIDKKLVKLERVRAGHHTGYIFDSMLVQNGIQMNWVAEDFVDEMGVPLGIGGDPAGASAEKGEIIFDVSTEKIVAGLMYIAGLDKSTKISK